MMQASIAIIGAMDEEIALILNELEESTPFHRAGITFYRGKFHEKEIVVCKSGVGKVNAAVVTQILIDQFQVKSVVFTGVAGALGPDLEIGDIVISSSCMYHDMDVTALGFAKGEIPYQEHSIFHADERLVQLACEAGKKLYPLRVFQGRILSGDQFITDRLKVVALHTELSGLCTEMEGAAVAHVCSINDIPFVIIRSMSDKADGSAHLNFAEFTKQASLHSFLIVSEIMQSLSN